MDCPEGQRYPDDRRQCDGRKVAGKYRGGADADCHLPEVEQGVAGQPDRRGGPKRHTQVGLCRPDQKRATEQQEYQSDIAQEMLIEGPGGCDAGDRLIPVGGGHKHEDAVRYHRDAKCYCYAEAC